ncbi:glycosyltransferase [Streptomyces sp. HUAS TT20]|uniref:glycosyltransferase n=1 Tax=Streptomyces sp. HUAS TT20 TaxID=3447509 RepID=UPI0021DB5272|nr:glycosyltransferase [Streptomyces sp. HUAS 15-9]UXY33042.1 glycosyltransferase [Streptomyces sp. HUAS 15-9]
MRILFAGAGNFGHVYPLLPLAKAARAAGHEVSFATGEQLHPAVVTAGLEPVAAGRSVPEAFMEAVSSRADLAGAGELGAQDVPPEVLADLHVQVFGSVLPRWVAADLATALERLRPDLVVYEALNPGAAFAAALAGVPAVAHGVGVMALGPEEERIQQELLATAGDLGVDVPFGQLLALSRSYIDIVPPSIQDPGFLAAPLPRIEQRTVAYSEPGQLPERIRESGKPFVYLTLGTALGSPEVLRSVLQGLLPLDVPVLVAAGPVVPVEELGELPERVVAVPWVAQPEALKHASVVVQHGGAGTTLATLAAGLPQLVLPQGADGPANGRAVAAAGAGEVVLAADQSPEAVTEATRRLLAEEGYRVAAGKVAAEIAAMPDPAENVTKLVELAG